MEINQHNLQTETARSRIMSIMSKKNLRFSANKSYTGFRLTLNSTTWDDPKHQNGWWV